MDLIVFENLSPRKLYAMAAGLALLLGAFFLIGVIVAPSPSNVQQILGTKCILPRNKDYSEHWSIPRDEGACVQVKSLDDEIIQKQKIKTQDIVFSFWIPGPRNGVQLAMTPWFQTILGLLMVDVEFIPQNEHKNDDLKLELKLGYRSASDKPTEWKSLANSTESRKLECTINLHQKFPGSLYNCSMLSLFELGSCAHDFYLLNIRLPALGEDNKGIGKVVEMWLVVIQQSGGFTKVWFSVKTLFFPIGLIALIWYWGRIRHLHRNPRLLEKNLCALGISITFLNLPVEWLTIWADAPFIPFYTCIRQGLFLAMLLSFCLIFVGEHWGIEKKTLASYWLHLCAVAFGCLAIVTFEMCERGIPFRKPFSSLWITESGKKAALAFIVTAGMSACGYFLFLSHMVCRFFLYIRANRKLYSAVPKGIIYRFKFLMITTLLCAALTVIFFILSQVQKVHGHLYIESPLTYTSGFFIGVYSMWNVYGIALLALYSPSHGCVTQQNLGLIPDRRVSFLSSNLVMVDEDMKEKDRVPPKLTAVTVTPLATQA